MTHKIALFRCPFSDIFRIKAQPVTSIHPGVVEEVLDVVVIGTWIPGRASHRPRNLGRNGLLNGVVSCAHNTLAVDVDIVNAA
jgi:hypothetical protein